jgi:hypothetical protein
MHAAPHEHPVLETTTPELKFSVHTRPGDTVANDDKSPLMASAKKPNNEIPKDRNK